MPENPNARNERKAASKRDVKITQKPATAIDRGPIGKDIGEQLDERTEPNRRPDGDKSRNAGDR